jgi:hypothetical protein
MDLCGRPFKHNASHEPPCAISKVYSLFYRLDDDYRFDVKIRSDAYLCPACLREVFRWPLWVYARVSGTKLKGVLKGTNP